MIKGMKMGAQKVYSAYEMLYGMLEMYRIVRKQWNAIGTIGKRPWNTVSPSSLGNSTCHLLNIYCVSKSVSGLLGNNLI